MTLTANDLETLCTLAIEAAVTTGQYIARSRPLSVEHKDNSGSLATQVVTEVDRESEKRIIQGLASSFSRYNLGLLTEESPDDGSRLVRDYFWCIDPLDGTLCFIEGSPGYAVSIALISRAGIPFIGVVYDPVERVLYHAIRDGGAFRNATRWQPDLRRARGPLTIFSDRSEVESVLFEPIGRAMNASWGICGGGVMNALWCLEHAPACYFKFRKPGSGGGCFWDFAATNCIYREVGAWASDVDGAAIDFNRAESIELGHCGILYATHAAVARQFLTAQRKLQSSEGL